MVVMKNKDNKELWIVGNRQKDKERVNYREGCLSWEIDGMLGKNKGLMKNN